MSEIYTRQSGGNSLEEVSDENPLATKLLPDQRPLGPLVGGAGVAADYLWRLALEGRLFTASDTDQNDLITGQTSFADTTPSILLRVPAGTVALPLFVNLSQTGSVAGGAIDVIIEIDDADRYASGGTVETTFSGLASRRRRPTTCSPVTGATTSSGYGNRVWAATIGQDVSPAEGAVQGPFWRPEMPYFLEGPASFLVYTYAGTTGPTWFWSLGWAEWSVGEMFGA